MESHCIGCWEAQGWSQTLLPVIKCSVFCLYTQAELIGLTSEFSVGVAEIFALGVKNETIDGSACA